MARYNTSLPTATTSTTATIGAPSSGLLTTFTGTAPYTVTLASPVLYLGQAQTFFNSTSGVITLTLSGVTPGTPYFVGPGTVGSQVTLAMPANTITSLTSDGTNYVIANGGGGPLTATTGAFSSDLTVTGNGQFNGTFVRASSSFTPSSTYDLTTLTYIQSKYGQVWSVISSNTAASAGARYFVDTSSVAITVTLPSSPTLGDAVHFVDYSGTFQTRNLTVANNGNRIQRILDVMTVSTNGAAFQLVWSGSTNGWLVAQGI